MNTLSQSISKLEAAISFIRKTKSLYKSTAKAHSDLVKRYQDSVKKLVSEDTHYDKFFEKHRKCMLVYIKLQQDCKLKFLELHEEMKVFHAFIVKTWENLRLRKKNHDEYERSCRKILGFSNLTDDKNRQGHTEKADQILKQTVGTQNSLIVQEFSDIADSFTENAFLKAKMCMVYQFNAYQGKFYKVEFSIKDLRKELSRYLTHINHSRLPSYIGSCDHISEVSHLSKLALAYKDLSVNTRPMSKEDQNCTLAELQTSKTPNRRSSMSEI